ncbi:hypothetical protein N658DRAFT_357129 [Parathielavia hyrcaniae]|uniref:Uncharacterized protein n=1 Tax=Parathielavia hyrcaniae TaxID=113614 RepID=A0AAN6T331_9PEZI|nr:hypothetical protein N658DRAFT_357129 [Parathielavia hyrcaniae]
MFVPRAARCAYLSVCWAVGQSWPSETAVMSSIFPIPSLVPAHNSQTERSAYLLQLAPGPHDPMTPSVRDGRQELPRVPFRPNPKKSECRYGFLQVASLPPLCPILCQTPPAPAPRFGIVEPHTPYSYDADRREPGSPCWRPGRSRNRMACHDMRNTLALSSDRRRSTHPCSLHRPLLS